MWQDFINLFPFFFHAWFWIVVLLSWNVMSLTNDQLQARTQALEARVGNISPTLAAAATAAAAANSGVTTLQSQSGSFAGFSGDNSSYSMPNGTSIAYDPSSSSNNGGVSSSTSGQIGGAAAHTHDMTHMHTTDADLQNIIDALVTSVAAYGGDLNTMYTKLHAAGIL